jgi:DNA-directed RNA polymerase specialized sigma24 family protein
MELVRQYAAHQSESAIAALVSRHSNLVYSASLRRVRDPQLAEEVTQAVFIILARKVGSFDRKTILPGGLYRTACFVAGSALKQEYRRQQREREPYMQGGSNLAGVQDTVNSVEQVVRRIGLGQGGDAIVA